MFNQTSRGLLTISMWIIRLNRDGKNRREWEIRFEKSTMICGWCVVLVFTRNETAKAFNLNALLYTREFSHHSTCNWNQKRISEQIEFSSCQSEIEFPSKIFPQFSRPKIFRNWIKSVKFSGGNYFLMEVDGRKKNTARELERIFIDETHPIDCTALVLRPEAALTKDDNIRWHWIRIKFQRFKMYIRVHHRNEQWNNKACTYVDPLSIICDASDRKWMVFFSWIKEGGRKNLPWVG